MKINKFTPLFDFFEDDLITAAVFGKIWRVCDWSEANECSLSNETIGKQLGGISTKTVQRRKEKLEEMGLIKVKKRKGYSDLIKMTKTTVMSIDLESIPLDRESRVPKTESPIPLDRESNEDTKEDTNIKKVKEDKTTVVTDVFSLYCQEIGKPKGIEKEMLYGIIRRYPEDMIRRAIKECSVNNVLKMSYLKAVLKGMSERAEEYAI